MIKLFGQALVLSAFVAASSSNAWAGQVHKVSILNGGQEVPSVSTAGSGCARMTVDTDANTVTYHIAFSGLSAAETAAHFHGPAGIGQNAGVMQALPLGNPKVGVWNYAEADEATILAGNVYINIHTGANPGGELRGQLADMVAVIGGDQENPPVSSVGSGYGLFNLDACANELSYHISFSGVAETAAHIHGYTLHEANAGVVHGLPAGSPKVGVFAYSQANEARILNGQTYVNIHSAAHPGGEIRGQVTRMVVPVDGGQEAPPSGSPGSGCGLLALDPAGDDLSFRLEYQGLTGPATAAHIHGFAAPGSNAGVQFGIGTVNPVKDTWSYPAASEAQILGGLTYYNVHTGAHPGGEIRGQLIFPPAPCPADTNCDGEVSVADLTNVILAWGTNDPAADVNGDGIVDVADLTAVILAWGAC